MLFIAAFATFIIFAEGFTAYDCHNHSGKVLYSGSTIPSCSPQQPLPAPSVLPSFTLLQLPQSIPIVVTVVSLKQSTEEIYCSFERHNDRLLIPRNHLGMQPKTVSPSASRSYIARSVREEKYRPGIVGPTPWTYYQTSGNVDEKGHCTDWSSYQTVVVEGHQVQDATAQARYDSEGTLTSIHLWGEGVEISPHGTYGSLPDGSLVSWSASENTTCQLEVLYSGEAMEFKTILGQNYFYIEKMTVGSEILGLVSLCKHKVLKTSTPFLYAMRQEPSSILSFAKQPSVHWSSYVHSGLQYQVIQFSLALDQASRQYMINQCSLESMIYKDILFGAHTDPDMTGFRLMGDLGWSILMAGGGAYLIKCTPVDVVLFPQPKCYHRIPVSKNNSTQLLFIDPVTKVLKASSKKIECSDPSNPVFEIRKQWYKLTPTLHDIPTPSPFPSQMHLDPSTVSLAVAGLYSKEVLEADQELGWLRDREEQALSRVMNSEYDKGTATGGGQFWEEGGSWGVAIHPDFASLVGAWGGLAICLVILVGWVRSQLQGFQQQLTKMGESITPSVVVSTSFNNTSESPSISQLRPPTY